MLNAKSLDHSGAPDTARKSDSADPARRRFLFTLGVSSAGAVVATAGALPAVAAAQAEAAPNDKDSSYSETEHVRDYYRTTRV